MKRFRNAYRIAFIAGLLETLCACQARPPLTTASRVDLPRFMGDWYVIACIPTYIERQAFAPKESYQLDPAGRVRTVFTYRHGAFDGPVKRYTPVGYVQAEGNGAVWKMQFIWPFRADYRIVYVDADYTMTVIGRQKRDFAWIMARTPQISEADYDRLRSLLASEGYDTGKLRKMPQPLEP